MTADRIRVWLMILILAMITLGSFWVWELMRRNAENKNSSSSSRTFPDYYVENFNFVRLSKNGDSSYRMSGKSLTHYPRDDEYKIIEPRIIGFDKNRNPINLQANSAIAQQQVRNEETNEINDEIHLFGDVTLDRPANGEIKPFHLLSPYLMLMPNKKMIKSDQEITLTSIGTNIHAVGLFVDYANDKLQLLSHVDILIEPQKNTIIKSSRPPKIQNTKSD